MMIEIIDYFPIYFVKITKHLKSLYGFKTNSINEN